MAIPFPALPFALDALAPFISKKTLEFHYQKHHKTYVDKLNELIRGEKYDRENLEEIIISSYSAEEKIFNNAGQAWNHQFMWNCLSGSKNAPTKNVVNLLNRSFGSFGDFQDEFNRRSKEHFGSGWAWLVKDKNGLLKIRCLANAENPLLNQEVAIFTCDLWEHAYYLDYQNDRAKYLKNYWSILNWEFIEKQFDQRIQGTSNKEYKMRVSECMTKQVEIGNPTMTLQEAAKKMRDGDFGCLPIGENDRLVGMLTDRDIVVRAVVDGKDVKSTQVRDVMSTDVMYCYEDQTIDEVADNLGSNQIRRLPVLNRQKRLVGILSLGDLSHSDVDAQKVEKALYRNSKMKEGEKSQFMN
jgi:superoxide dismutase, Fe-Mn family